MPPYELIITDPPTTTKCLLQRQSSNVLGNNFTICILGRRDWPCSVGIKQQFPLCRAQMTVPSFRSKPRHPPQAIVWKPSPTIVFPK